MDGPLFTGGTTGPGVRCNCADRKHLPSAFRGPQIVLPDPDMSDNNSLHRKSAPYPLYPVGSPVDIYNNPANPSEAYVQRPVKGNASAVSGDGDIRIAYYTFSSDQECRRAYEKNRYRYTTMPAHIETNGTDTQQKKRKRSRRENSWGLRLPACG